MAGEIDKILWDVAIVGSGFAGALIANELGKGRRRVIILEAGEGIPANINKYMSRFYSAIAKVPESPYTPEIFGRDGKLIDPATVAAGRPTVVSLGAKNWREPKEAYLILRAHSAAPTIALPEVRRIGSARACGLHRTISR